MMVVERQEALEAALIARARDNADASRATNGSSGGDQRASGSGSRAPGASSQGDHGVVRKGFKQRVLREVRRC